MQLSHEYTAVFDDPNLVSCAGLAPVLTLAERAGLGDLIDEQVSVPGSVGANARAKVLALVAGMVAGVDTIDGMGLLRHGGMRRLFSGLRAASTLGTFLRAFTFGHVRQLDAVASRLLIALACRTPLLAGAGAVGYVDIDDTVKATYGYGKQGAGYGYSRIKGLNALLATLSTPLAAPVILASRLRKGATHSASGAPKLLAEALKTAKAAGAKGLLIVRADSAFYRYDVLATILRHKARFSVTARQDPSVRKAIGQIPDDAWVAISYPNAVWDDAAQEWISDAEVAEIDYTAFTSRNKGEQIDGRLIVRRVKRLNPRNTAGDTQHALFASWRYHAVFTTSPLRLIEAEAAHRGHAIIEQVISELKDGPIAHLPSSAFNANGAWLALACLAFNLTRASGCLASTFHAKARAATIRAQLINVPGRLARSARRLTLHLPDGWLWQPAWEQLDQRARGTPVLIKP